MEEQKKEGQPKTEPELIEKIDTDFPLSGGETDEDLEKALGKKDDKEEEDENAAP